jgi:MFS family permease
MAAPPYPDLDQDVSRDTLAQLDEAQTCAEHWKILLTAGMGFFADAYDLFIIGVVAAVIAGEWHLAGYQKSLLTSLALLTSAAGAVCFGRLADKLGRTRIYGYEVIVLAAGAIASACAPGIWWLIGFRAVLGFGIGGDYPVSATIMSECASRHDRGRLVALVFAMQGAGLVVGPLVAIALLKGGLSEDLAWRVMLALGAVPALSVFWLRRRIKETPRFRLAQNEAADAARAAMLAGQPTGIRGLLADRRLRRWLAGASLAWLLFDFTYYGDTISTPLIDKLVAPHASQIGTLVITLVIFAVAALPGYLLAAATIDKLGRRRMQATGFAVVAAAFLALWLIPGATTTLVPFLVLFGLSYFFAEFGPNTTTFVFPAEIFPVRVRTTGHGIASACGKLGAFAGTYTLTALLPAIGFTRTSAIVAGVSLLGLLVTVMLLPEPKGLSLEELTETSRLPMAWSALLRRLALLRQERAEGAEVEVQVLRLEAEVLAQLGHPLLQPHERVAEPFGLLVGDGAVVDAPDGLALHELAEQFHDREDEGGQPAFGRALVVAVKPVANRLRHAVTSPRTGSCPSWPGSCLSCPSWPGSCPASALTEASSARSDTVTRSTSAIDSVISPVTTTPSASTRSSRSTSATRCAG